MITGFFFQWITDAFSGVHMWTNSTIWNISNLPDPVGKLKKTLFTADQTSFLLIMKHTLYLPVENFDLTAAHACGPISHAWLKNVSCCRLAWHNFQKYINSDPCKERKPCVKWLNNNNYYTFHAISDFWKVKSTGSELVFIRILGLGLGLRKTSNFFARLWTSSESSEMIKSSSKLPVLSG